MRLGKKIFSRMTRGYSYSRGKFPANMPVMPSSPLHTVPRHPDFNQPHAEDVHDFHMQPAPLPHVMPSLEPLIVEHEDATKSSSSDGFDIPDLKKNKVKIKEVEQDGMPKKSITYPLIPRNPTKGEPIFAYVTIKWDPKQNQYTYNVTEPTLTEEMRGIMTRVKDLLEERLDIDFSKLKLSEATDYLDQQINQALKYYNLNLSNDERLILGYYIRRDFIGLGRLEPIMKDPNIEDISCDGTGIPIFVFHRNQIFGSLATNVQFDDSEELDSFIIKLSQLSGKSISVSNPLVDGSMPDGSRLQATLATDIARKGSNFTIRKFTDEPLTPTHLMNYGTVDARTLAYLWMAVDFGRSILLSGGTASGKTSFLNVLSLFIRPDKKIVSIEDTAELKLPHPHWVPTVARVAVSTAGQEGSIDMFDLLKESLRQRPDYIIVGEVRGQEAYILFQQMATGHPSLATIHADSVDKLVDRLTTAPISLPKTLIGSLDLLVFIKRVRYKDKFVRRVSDVLEILDFPQDARSPVTSNVFTWNPVKDKIESDSKSMLLKKISDGTGIPEQEIKEELKRRILVLEWIKERNISKYDQVYSIFNLYYNHPNRLLSTIMGEV